VTALSALELCQNYVAADVSRRKFIKDKRYGGSKKYWRWVVGRVGRAALLRRHVRLTSRSALPGPFVPMFIELSKPKRGKNENPGNI
jgi:hypothetical protein